MKNTAILFSIAAIILLVGGFVFVNGKTQVTGNVVAGPTLDGEVQKVTLGTKDYNYWPNEITVKAGKPVELTMDSSVKGCLRSFAIRDLGISGYSKNPAEKITFTPTQKGAFKFTCSMGMGYGTINVV